MARTKKSLTRELLSLQFMEAANKAGRLEEFFDVELVKDKAGNCTGIHYRPKKMFREWLKGAMKRVFPKRKVKANDQHES
jgi:hypothetical protein